jgi:tRNA threonylcarbamoyladenosine biosynthesis protein TsaB
VSGAWLILETAGRVGRVGLARGGTIVQSTSLDESRRHARDLAATIGSVLKQEDLTPKDLHGVMVGIGPGSYTGLRVGVVSAKVLAYATGCRLVAVPTFRAVAERLSREHIVADVIGDALRNHVYVQRFRQVDAGWIPADELRIELMAEWVERFPAGAVVTGPGVTVYDSLIPAGIVRVPESLREPSVESMFAAGVQIEPLGRDDQFRLEPLYLRGSSAEEKARADGNARPGVPPR